MPAAPSRPPNAPARGDRARALDRALAVLALAAGVFVLALVPGASVRGWKAAGDAAAPAAARTTGLRLTLQSADLAPVVGASVRLYAETATGPVPRGEGATDGAGQLVLNGLPEGAYWIVAEAPRLAREATMMALAAGEPYEARLTLKPAQALRVRVRDEGGAAVRSAVVEVRAGGPMPVAAASGDDGVAEVRQLGGGPYVVRARAEGFDEVERSGVRGGETAEVTLVKSGSLRVAVEQAAGGTANGATVEIAGGALGEARAALVEGGRAVFRGLRRGSYALRAVRGAEVSPTELDVRLASGEEKEVTLRLAAGRFVSVVALADEASGERPVGGAAVVVAEDGVTPFPLEARTGGDGKARLGPLAGDFATVSVQASGYVGRSGVPAPRGTGEVRVVLPRAASLTGRVLDRRGFPVGGVTLRVVGSDVAGLPIDEDPLRAGFRDALFARALAGPALVPRGELGVVPGPVAPIPPAAALVSPAPATPRAPTTPPREPWATKGDGTFRIEPVPPGRVRLVARHPQYVEALSDVVALAPGGTAEVNVTLGEGALVEGVVLDGRGRGVGQVRVTAVAREGTLERSVRTGDDGRFAFAAMPSGLSLLAEADDGRAARVTLTLEEATRREVKLVLPEPRELVLFRVKDDRDYPVDGVELGASSLDVSAPLRATLFTDARGEARLRGARGLPLRVTTAHPRYAPQAITFEQSGEKIELVLIRGETVVGEISGRRRGALAGAEVVVFAATARARGVTNARGEFRVDGVAPGPAKLVVRAAEHARFERAIVVDARRSDRGFDVGRIELDPECVAEGEVVDDAGKPVAGARVAVDHAPTWVPVGPLPRGVVATNARGAFRLGELSEGTVDLEAYAPDVGRGRLVGVRVSPGRPTGALRIVLAPEGKTPEIATTGNVAVTLGLLDDGSITIASVTDGSTAERAGLAAGDRLVEVDGQKVQSMQDARAKLAGPLQDDVVVGVVRDGRALTLRVPREPSRR